MNETNRRGFFGRLLCVMASIASAVRSPAASGKRWTGNAVPLPMHEFPKVTIGPPPMIHSLTFDPNGPETYTFEADNQEVLYENFQRNRPWLLRRGVLLTREPLFSESGELIGYRETWQMGTPKPADFVTLPSGDAVPPTLPEFDRLCKTRRISGPVVHHPSPPGLANLLARFHA